MAINRLHLDFTIDTSIEREKFVHAYLNKELNDNNDDNHYINKYNKQNSPFPFPYTPNQDELETIANYILYGKSTSNGKFYLKDKKGVDGTSSLVDAGYIEIPTRNSPWNRKQEESLNSMLEISNDTGNPVETQFNLIGGLNGRTPSERPKYKVSKETFSREECRANLSSSPFILQQYEALWRQIDVSEYTISSYELKINKRKNPIRQELEDRLTSDEKDAARERCTHLNPFTWSKLRKHLVELRQQQYIWRDSYAMPLSRNIAMKYTESPDAALQFNAILPCAAVNANSDFLNKLFMVNITEEHFTPAFQSKLIEFLQQQDKELNNGSAAGVFDFRKPEHIALLIYAQNEIAPQEGEEVAMEENEYLNQFIETLHYYINVAVLEPLHRDIIKMKTAGHKNEDIAAYVNKKYGKTYSANYISTIFRAKCCGGIADAAVNHWAIVDKLAAGIEEFKRCNTCSKLLLRDANNYVRKARANDGLSGRCKLCDKIARQSKKKNNGGNN